MNYQRIVCWGDSQTYGARTYGCYPLHLVTELDATTQYRWSALNLSTNGHTARDLWFRLTNDLAGLRDVYTACLLIGANDVGNSTPIDLFAEYYRQILSTLQIAGIKRIHCGEIPPLWPDGHAFFDKDCVERRDLYNKQVSLVVGECDVARLVEFPDMEQNCFVDPAHFSELGNQRVAASFATAVRDS